MGGKLRMEDFPADVKIYDVIVIGGGINGTSAARELSAVGYKVLLVEKGDFAEGASSRSSRILHCGLRYFETARPIRTFLRAPGRLKNAVMMAKSAMLGREELVRLRPERCKPFTMCFPLYQNGPFQGWHLDVGFALLKRLGPAEPKLDYRRVTKDFERTIPFATDLRDRNRLQSIATYREYIIDWPDRLCVDSALEAERNGAEIRLFTAAYVRERNPEGLWMVDLEPEKGSTVTVRGSMVLNLTGTWIDDVVKPHSGHVLPRLIHGTKGAHVLVRLPDEYKGFGITSLNRLGLPIYCLPFKDNLYQIGPTETPFEGDAGHVSVDDDEIDFLLSEINFLMPGLALTRKHVEFTWAGVRPLTYNPENPDGDRVRQIHDLSKWGHPGILAMTAGPVMSHLSAGRELLSAVNNRFSTAHGQKVKASSAVTQSSEPRDRFTARNSVLYEHAQDLNGILYTRTGVAWGTHLDRKIVIGVAHEVAEMLGWDKDRLEEEVDLFMTYQETIHRSGKTVSENIN